MKRIDVFSDKLKRVIPVEGSKGIIDVPVKKTVIYCWSDSGWCNDTGSWSDGGWCNDTGSWSDNGWCNDTGGWSDGGWCNDTGSWSDSGWNND